MITDKTYKDIFNFIKDIDLKLENFWNAGKGIRPQWIKLLNHVVAVLLIESNYIQLNDSVNLVLDMIYNDNRQIMRSEVTLFIYLLQIKLLMEHQFFDDFNLFNAFKNQIYQATGQSRHLISQTQERRFKNNVIFEMSKDINEKISNLYNQYNIFTHTKYVLDVINEIYPPNICLLALKEDKHDLYSEIFTTYLVHTSYDSTPAYFYTVSSPLRIAFLFHGYWCSNGIPNVQKQEEFLSNAFMMYYWKLINTTCETILDLTMFFWVMLKPTEDYYTSNDIKELFLLINKEKSYLKSTENLEYFLNVNYALYLDMAQDSALFWLGSLLKGICMTDSLLKNNESFFEILLEHHRVFECIMCEIADKRVYFGGIYFFDNEFVIYRDCAISVISEIMKNFLDHDTVKFMKKSIKHEKMLFV